MGRQVAVGTPVRLGLGQTLDVAIGVVRGRYWPMVRFGMVMFSLLMILYILLDLLHKKGQGMIVRPFASPMDIVASAIQLGILFFYGSTILQTSLNDLKGHAAAGVEIPWRAMPLAAVTAIVVTAITGGGLFLFVLPGLFVGTFCAFAIAFSLEGASPIPAITGSILLVKQRFWRVFAVLLFSNLPVFVFLILLGIVSIAVGHLLPGYFGIVVSDALSALWLSLLAPFLPAAVAVLYEDARSGLTATPLR